MRVLRFKQSAWLPLAFLVLIAGLILMPVPAIAQDPPPDRPDSPPSRPDPPPSRPDPPVTRLGGGDKEKPDRDAPASLCSTVYGVVTNWGYRNEPKLPVDISGADFLMQKTTDDNGFYASDCMGLGIGLVNVTVPPGLNPLTSDVAVRLGYRSSFEVNLGIYGDGVTPSLQFPVMTASETSVAPGEMLSHTIGVSNAVGSPIWEDAIVTDLLPGALTPTTVTSTRGTVEIWDNLITADLGDLQPGQGATIIITALVQPDVPPGSTISNRATLIYKDHLAVQTTLITMTVEAGEIQLLAGSGDNSANSFDPPLVLPETGAGKLKNCPGYLDSIHP